MLPTAESILKNIKPNKVQRTVTQTLDTVYFVYVNKKGVAYTILLDPADWQYVSELPITVELVGKSKTPRVTIRYNKISYVLARFILVAPEDKLVDHIDWNPLNNKRSNLRLCTESENNQNKRLASNNSSGIRGISWSTYYGKWVVTVAHDNERKSLGLFDDINDANNALVAYKKLYMPFTPEARG